MVDECTQTLEARSGIQGSDLQPKHRQGLVESPGQAIPREIVGAHEAVPLAAEHPDSSAAGEGRVDAGDVVLFGEQTEIIGSFSKHLDERGPGRNAPLEKVLQQCGSVGREKSGGQVRCREKKPVSGRRAGNDHWGSGTSGTVSPSRRRCRASGGACGSDAQAQGTCRHPQPEELRCC